MAECSKRQVGQIPKWCASVAVVTLLFAMAFAIFNRSPHQADPNASLPQLLAGQIIETCGKYRFPTGDSSLEVTEDQSGNISVAVRVQSSVVWCLPLTRIPYRTASWSYIEHQITVESELVWFVSVDQYERLWVYYGNWDSQWGELRKRPSGGTRPYASAVIMAGLSFLSSGALALGSEVVTETNNWAGVPVQFLDRVRSASATHPSKRTSLPLNTPTLTKEQRVQMIQRLCHAIE